MRGRTVALIVDPDTKVADVFVFKGSTTASLGIAAGESRIRGELQVRESSRRATARPSAAPKVREDPELYHGTLEKTAKTILKEGFEPHRPEYLGRRISGVWGAEDKVRALSYGFDRAREVANAAGETPKTLRAAVISIANPAEAGFRRENFDPYEKHTWVAPNKIPAKHIKQVEIYETPFKPRADVIDLALKALKGKPAKTIHGKDDREIVYMVLVEGEHSLAESEVAHEDDDAA